MKSKQIMATVALATVLSMAYTPAVSSLGALANVNTGSVVYADDSITSLTPIVTPAELHENDAKAGTVIATLSMPAGYTGDVTYELTDNSDGMFANYTPLLTIDGNKIKLSDKLTSWDDLSSDARELWETKSDYSDGVRRVAADFAINFGVKAKASDGSYSKPYFTYTTDAYNPIKILNKEIRDESESSVFSLSSLKYYLGTLPLASVTEDMWQELPADQLALINGTNGTAGDKPLVTINTNVGMPTLLKDKLYLKPTFSKEDVTSYANTDNIFELVRDVNNAEKYIEVSSVSFGKSTFIRTFKLRVNSGSNIAEVTPVVTTKTLTEEEAKGGALLASVAMPEEYNGEAPKFKLDFSDKDDLYSKIIKIDGKDIKLVDDLHEVLTLDYPDDAARLGLLSTGTDGKTRIKSGVSLPIPVVAEYGTSKSHIADVNLVVAPNPVVTTPTEPETNTIGTGTTATTVDLGDKLGWVEKDGNWYYVKADHNKATNWNWINGAWFYLNEDGVMQTGFLTDNDKTYYLKDWGGMATGWMWIKDAWYYFDGTGAMKTGWFQDGNKWYHLDDQGRMHVGWHWVKDAWYYLDGTGAMKTGWFQDADKWYYLNNSGKMLVGWNWINGGWYYLDGTGAMKTGWFKENGKTYYLKHYGAMAVGTINIDGVNHTFDGTGALVK